METKVTHPSTGTGTGTALETVDDEAEFHLTTREGWRRFTAEQPTPPRRLTSAEYAALPGPEREIDDEARLDHHARLLVVATSTVRHTVTCGRRLVLLNRHAISARRGLIVSGPAGTG
jgi:hypothetical protein